MKGVKAILLAAGNGERFGDPIPKQFHALGGKPLYRYSYDTMSQSNLFEEIVLVCHPDWVDQVDVAAIAGGHTRQESVYLGLLAAGATTDTVVIHDAARPFVSLRILEESIRVASRCGACDTCIPSTDTLVATVDGKVISSIPDRSLMRRGQTPQSFHYPLILQAHQRARAIRATDDCQLVTRLGHPVHIIQGDEKNIKITTRWDWQWAELFLGKTGGSIYPKERHHHV